MTESRKQEAEYPFLFYGASPGDWFGDTSGYEIRFEKAPTPKRRLKIAEVLVRYAEMQTIHCTDEPWAWCGDWAAFTIDELSDKAFFKQAQKLLQAIHRVAPLVEVHCGGAKGAGRKDAWSEWSVRQKPVPGPAPDWPGIDLNLDWYAEGIERTKGTFAQDPAFERARGVVDEEEIRRGQEAYRKKWAQRLVEARSLIGSGKLMTLALGDEEIPDEPEPEPLPKWILSRRSGKFTVRHAIWTGPGRAFAMHVVGDEDGLQPAIFGDRRELKVDVPMVGYYVPETTDVAPDQRSLVFVASLLPETRRSLFVVDPQTGALLGRWTPPGDEHVLAASFCAGGIAALTTRRFVIVKVRDGAVTVLHDVEAAVGHIVGRGCPNPKEVKITKLCSGRGLLVSGLSDPYAGALLAVDETRLALVARRFEVPIENAVHRQGRLFVYGAFRNDLEGRGEQWAWAEVLDFAPAVEKALAVRSPAAFDLGPCALDPEAPGEGPEELVRVATRPPRG